MVKVETLADFVARHRRMFPEDDLRLGQRFCNEFIVGQWPALYYQGNENLALQLIREYLERLHYFPHLPPKRPA